MSKKEEKPDRIASFWNWVKGNTTEPTMFDVVVLHFKSKIVHRSVDKITHADIVLQRDLAYLSRLEKSLKRSNVGPIEYQWARLRYKLLLLFYS